MCNIPQNYALYLARQYHTKYTQPGQILQLIVLVHSRYISSASVHGMVI